MYILTEVAELPDSSLGLLPSVVSRQVCAWVLPEADSELSRNQVLRSEPSS